MLNRTPNLRRQALDQMAAPLRCPSARPAGVTAASARAAASGSSHPTSVRSRGRLCIRCRHPSPRPAGAPGAASLGVLSPPSLSSLAGKPLAFGEVRRPGTERTAWFIGLLPEARRHTRAIRFVVASIVGAGVLEVGYITLQSALGQASHYNFSDLLHLLLYQLMGAGALLLCATQGVLALQISRHGRHDIDPAWRAAVVRGLWLTLALGAGAGALLGGIQAPDGTGLPVTGWHAAGDLRPAHCLGMHAQQYLPLLGLALAGRPAAQARQVLNLVVMAYVLLWLGLVAMGLHGAHPVAPPSQLFR